MKKTDSRTQLLDLSWIILLSMIARAWLIRSNPVLYHNDAYNRLFHSDTLLVKFWLPTLQGLLYLMARLNLSIVTIRLLLAAIGSFTCGSLYLFVSMIAKRTVALIAVLLFSSTPIFLTFSIVPYQEGLYFLFLFSALTCFAQQRRHRDTTANTLGSSMLLGIACLTRYEGWIMAGLLGLKWIVERASGLTLAGLAKLVAKAALLFCWAPIAWVVFTKLSGHPMGYLRDESLSISFSVSRIHDLMTRGTPVLLELLGVWAIAMGVIGLVLLRKRVKAQAKDMLLLFTIYVALVQGFMTFFNPYLDNQRLYLNLVILIIIGEAEAIAYAAQQLGRLKEGRFSSYLGRTAKVALLVLFTGLIMLTGYQRTVAQITRFTSWGGFQIPYTVAEFLRQNAQTGQTIAVVGELRPDMRITPFQMISVYVRDKGLQIERIEDIAQVAQLVANREPDYLVVFLDVRDGREKENEALMNVVKTLCYVPVEEFKAWKTLVLVPDRRKGEY